MRLLQQRLAETEAQMTKILQAMQSVQARVGVEQNKTEKEQSGETTQQAEETSQQDTSNNQGGVTETDDAEKKDEEPGVCIQLPPLQKDFSWTC